MNEQIRTVFNVSGRTMLALIFVMSAIGNKIPNFGDVTQYMASEGVPAAPLLLVGAIVFLIAGGISIVLGFKAKVGASLLMIFLALATYFFHDFWTYDPESKEFQMQMIQFMKNLALFGAMTMIVANGSGPGSLDNFFGEEENNE